MDRDCNDRIKISKRAEKIAPFYVMELLEKAKQMEARGENIVHMEVGEPDFPTPGLIKDEAIKAIRENQTFYTHSLGIRELREKVATHYQESEHVDVSPDRIVITNGSSGAFLLLCATLLEKGRTLGVSDPGYPCYKNFALLVDAGVVSLPVTEDTNYEVTADQINNLERTPDVLILSNPSNPTGSVYGDEAVSALYNAVSARGGILVSDEIYKGLAYGQTLRTGLSVSQDIIVVNGFSKTHAMTGWRLGWMVAPEDLVRPIQKVAQNVFISPPSVSQWAAMYAFDVDDDLQQMRTTYEKRRYFIVPRLRDLGFHIPIVPQGAFYVYAGIERWGIDSMEFVQRAIEEAKVALTPGYDFGSFRAGSHVRFSYANNLEQLREGCDRLEAWLKTLR